MPRRGVDGERFRQGLAMHASGVVVITASVEDRPVGLTISSFSSVSLHPPLVSFYIDRASTTWRSFRLAGHFTVNILASDQADVAIRFALKGVDRFAAPTCWSRGPDGVPLLDGVSAHLICRQHSTREVGDHILVIGHVVEVSVRATSQPLLYHQGRFGRMLVHT